MPATPQHAGSRTSATVARSDSAGVAASQASLGVVDRGVTDFGRSVTSPSRPRHGARAARWARSGVHFDPLLPYDAWRELGAKIGTSSNATSWWLGDWLAFGQMKYGRRYKDAIAATGLDYQTLRNYAVVARRFELSRRRDRLRFQHHAEVCALSDDEQDRWLDLAEAGRWSKRELRRRVRGPRPLETAHDSSHELRMVISDEHRDLWCDAAAACDRDLATWIVSALDSSALATLRR